MANKANLTPRQIVEKLGSIYRRTTRGKTCSGCGPPKSIPEVYLTDQLRDEVVPKNILMIGPTGVGKTEIARRMAKLVGAPFIKVEATKFTEVGYVGRDVESMVRDLVETSVRLVKEEKMAV